MNESLSVYVNDYVAELLLHRLVDSSDAHAILTDFLTKIPAGLVVVEVEQVEEALKLMTDAFTHARDQYADRQTNDKFFDGSDKLKRIIHREPKYFG